MRTFGGDRFEDTPKETFDFYGYVIEHGDILANNRAPFLEFWNIERIAKAGRLQSVYNKVRIGVDGYNDDPRELFEIAEVRRFLADLVDEWPHFFYVCDLKDSFLSTLVKCLIPNLKVIRAPNMPTDWRAWAKPAEMKAVYTKLERGLIETRAFDKGMSKARLAKRKEQIQKYLDQDLLP